MAKKRERNTFYPNAIEGVSRSESVDIRLDTVEAGLSNLEEQLDRIETAIAKGLVNRSNGQDDTLRTLTGMTVGELIDRLRSFVTRSPLVQDYDVLVRASDIGSSPQDIERVERIGEQLVLVGRE